MGVGVTGVNRGANLGSSHTPSSHHTPTVRSYLCFPQMFHVISDLSAFAYAALSAWNALLFLADSFFLQTQLGSLLP